ncbi:MAG: hypothetical protein AAGK77_05145 [Pseudomonadota bacterium]
MSDIDALQQRLAAAMDRIATGLGGLDSARTDTLAALQTALDDERTVNAQLNERVRKLSEAQDNAQATAEAAQTRMTTLDIELQRLRVANDQLRESNAALRAANEEGVGEPHLINTAMRAELEGLRAARAADVAEASSIISALTPLLDQLDVPEEEDADA